MSSTGTQARAVETPPPDGGRWWLPPVLRLLALLAALAAGAFLIWMVLRNVDAPSAGTLLSDYGYWGVALGAFGDSFGLPSSGEVVLLLASAAAAASSAHFNLPLVIAVAWAFAVAGDACAYAAGRVAGPRLLRRFGVSDRSAAHRFMERHGARAVTVARLVAGIRTKVAVVSGSTKMPFHRYVIADGIGAAIWAVTVGMVGYLFSSSVNRLVDKFGSATGVLGTVAVVVVVAVGGYLAYRYVRKHDPARRTAES
jgi:membrane protein DedA with SNARE-associated domain